MKTIYTFILMLSTTFTFAQYPDVSHESRAVKKEAEKITNIYDAQLGLDGNQLPIFQDKVEDYIGLSNKVKKDLDGKAELDALTSLMVKESLEMKDILTRIQYNVYKKIRQKIQPLKNIDTTSKK